MASIRCCTITGLWRVPNELMRFRRTTRQHYRMNGFGGHAFGIGPIATYFTKSGKSQLDFSARWVHDFDVSKQFAAMGSISARA